MSDSISEVVLRFDRERMDSCDQIFRDLVRQRVLLIQHAVDVLDEFAYLVVKYVDATGEDVAPSVTKKIFVGAPYTVNAVEVEGMEPDKDKATGEMTKDGATVTFTYTEKAAVTAKLHIEYTGPVGGDFVAPATVDEDVEVGTNYNVASPVVEGYTPDKAVVSGTMTEDGVNELIIYEKDEA